MSVPIKLGSAAGTVLIFETGSKINTSTSGVQSCTIKAVYGDGQNIFSKIPAAGTPFNEVFGNSYLPGDFKVDTTGGGYDIEYIEGKAARVTINFKRPDPAQPPGGNGQRARKVSVDSTIKYQNLVSSSIIGYAGGATGFGAQIGQPQDDPGLRYGFPEPVITVTYNQDARPTIEQMTRTLYIQAGDPRAEDFPDTPTITTPMKLPAPTGSVVAYTTNNSEVVVDGPLASDYTYTMNMLFAPSQLGFKLTGFKWEPHADEAFFDVTETWQMYYSITGSQFVSKQPGLG